MSDYELRRAKEDNLGYDLSATMSYNHLEDLLTRTEDIILELTGQNDGAEWHWIVKTSQPGWAYVTGGCDYTGWDCRSSCEAYESDSLEGALLLVPEDIRNIFRDMMSSGEKQRDMPSSW